jgi:hypothetical protein
MTTKDTNHLKKTNKNTITSAQFPGLVDLVTDNGIIKYYLKTPEGYSKSIEYKSSERKIYVPPGPKEIPFNIMRVEELIKFRDRMDGNFTYDDLYWQIFECLQEVSVLPSENHYHLVTVYIFFTYLQDAVDYYPILWFFGMPETGKSRIIKAIVNLSYRGFYTETLNPAYIFRFAELFHGTLGIDVYELIKRAKQKDSYDILLGRFERGTKIPRVIGYEKGQFKDMAFYDLYGPTVLGTNVEISVKDPLYSRCIRILMPEARGKYPNNNSFEQLVQLKSGLFTFRALYMDKTLPEIEKPVAGRLGDITHPLLKITHLLPREAKTSLVSFIESLENQRKEDQAETLSGKIAAALYTLQTEFKEGKLPVDRLNKTHGIATSPQMIGRELTVMGIERRKTNGGKMHIIWDENLFLRIWDRYGIQ